ncbi:MAG: TPM domain-containing protein [Thermoanaerobaculia bacterium]
MYHDRSCSVLASLLTLSLALAGSAARAVTVEQIPTPRPSGWAVDMTNTLPPERLAELNRLGEDVQTKAGAEMAVVVVGSTEGADPHDFATRLFNAWGIGNQTSKNGILVFAALNDHKAEIVLGHGLDTEAGRRESQTVMQQEMIPRFRNGDPSGAVVLGAIACARRILGVSPLVEGVELPPGMASAPEPVAPSPSGAGGTLPDGTVLYTDSGGITHTIPPAGSQPLQPLETAVQEEPFSGSGLSGLLWTGLLGAFFGTIGFVVLRTPRCSKCKQKMTMLDEQADDAYLEPSEKVEERIGSIDYQIWVCAACGERKKRRGSSFFSRYRNCPDCHAKTVSSTSVTLREATRLESGEVEVTQVCANCSFRSRYIRAIPRLEEPSYSSSSSSSSGSSFGSFSSSSGSSSSSSGSSSGGSSSSGFSGGSSSGGGASGSW